MFNLEFDPSHTTYVLIVLGHKGFPTFKAVHKDGQFLKKLGEDTISDQKSQFIQYQVIESNNVFTQTNPDYRFDHALDMIIQNLILGETEKKMLSQYS